MTFDELVQHEKGNAWINEPGFSGLYVRVGFIYVGKELIRSIMLANATVAHKGKGLFTRFITRIEKYQLPIFAENVLDDRFARFFLRLGFVSVEGQPRCFLKCSHINGRSRGKRT